MAVLVTGATGFLGSALVPLLDQKVYALARRPPKPQPNVVPLVGDVTQPRFGIQDIPKDIEAVWHLAADVDLGQSMRKVWDTNVGGTRNVVEFCMAWGIPRLLFVSTAYTLGRNAYERSKAKCEVWVRKYQRQGLRATIFRPSIMVADSRTLMAEQARGFYQLVGMIARVHRRIEVVRRMVEGALRLPVIEPVFRIRGDPEAKLNLIPVDAVAAFMLENQEKEGEFWVTNPHPPKLADLAEWVGEALLLQIRIERDFRATPLEALFHRMAGTFIPYLWGDTLPSDIKECPPVDRSYIRESSLKFILGFS